MQTRLDADIQQKTQLKQQVELQLQNDMQRFKDMEREAAALISKARHANSKLMVRLGWVHSRWWLSGLWKQCRCWLGATLECMSSSAGRWCRACMHCSRASHTEQNGSDAG